MLESNPTRDNPVRAHERNFGDTTLNCQEFCIVSPTFENQEHFAKETPLWL